MNTINEQTIDLLLSSKFDENFWFFQLGKSEIGIKDADDPEHQFMNSFFNKGEELWEKHKEKLKDYLCDKEKREPKEAIQEIISGNIRDFIAALINILISTYSISLSLAIPLTGIALKKGIGSFCKS